MSRTRLEPYRGSGIPIEYWGHVSDRSDNLINRQMLVVEVDSFTFRFVSATQIRDCIAYYERRLQPSSREDIGAADHWEAQRWFERLPMYLLEEPKRVKVLKALRRALKFAEDGTIFKQTARRK